MPRKDANPGKHEGAVERRLKAFDLRVAGVSYREIGYQLGVSEAQAHRDVKATLGTLAELEQATAEEYRAVELARLDCAALALYPLLESGDPQVINSWVRISESRRKLLGLDLQPGAVMPGNMDVILRWHDDNRRIIDVTPTDGRDAAAPPQIAESGGTAPRALPYRVRWSEMGQEPASGDAEPEDGARA
jgi:hypothetical protein